MPGEPQAAALLATAAAHGRQGAADQGRRYLTVLFSDVVGSTPLSERLDAEDYFAVIAAYRDVVREVIARHGGILDQFQGDGVLAYFGFPIAGEDDQVRAVEAGLDIVRAVPEAGARLGVDLQSRVGVHTGQTILTTSTLGLRGPERGDRVRDQRRGADPGRRGSRRRGRERDRGRRRRTVLPARAHRRAAAAGRDRRRARVPRLRTQAAQHDG